VKVHVDAATEQDARAILALRHDLEDWLESKGVEQWGRREVPADEVERQVAAAEWRVVRDPSGDLAAALRLLWSDEVVWQHQHGRGAYVHGLMVARHGAGRGLGTALLAWAEQRAQAARVPVLRLDCVESNEVLRRYYRRLGFVEVGRRDFDGPWYSAVLLEKVLHETHVQLRDVPMRDRL
jgi:ribosomal protein S18 acetylase RimI-like enzyme